MEAGHHMDELLDGGSSNQDKSLWTPSTPSPEPAASSQGNTTQPIDGNGYIYIIYYILYG